MHCAMVWFLRLFLCNLLITVYEDVDFELDEGGTLSGLLTAVSYAMDSACH